VNRERTPQRRGLTARRIPAVRIGRGKAAFGKKNDENGEKYARDFG
jgi:hypothetical protein